MSVKKPLLARFKSAIFGVVFAILGIFGALSINTFINPVNTAYAEPAAESVTESATESTSENNASNTTSETGNNTSDNTESVDTCQTQVGALAFIICPGTGVLSQAVDSIYSQIEKLLVVEPISFNSDSPIFQIWQIMRDITNIVFVIMILIVIYSQITGIGISNYGIKKALPKLIIAALLVNLSYIICAAGVDISNIVGSGLRSIFENIQVTAINNGGLGDASMLTWTDIATAMIGGGAVAGIAIGVAGGLGAVLFPFLAAILGAIISVVVGLFTLGLRQALISMLVMVSPIAFVCYLLPNTEKWFERWKDIFFSMLFFYPLFSLLYGASQLAGWALIASSVAAGSLFGIIIGLAVQVIPLILSIALMKMSGTVLGKISGIADNLANKPRDGLRGLAAQRSELSRQRRVNNSTAPTARLQRYMDNRRRKLELDTENETRRRRARSEIYAQRSILGSQKYDPAFVDEYKKGTNTSGARSKNRIRTTAATRAAKDAMNLELAAQTATKDTAHVLGNYGDYHYRTTRDRKLATVGGQNFYDFDRALHAEENDSFSDQDWLIGQYDKARKAGEDSYDYKHYIVGAAGSLGKAGENMVLGQVIHASAKNEATRRSYQNLVFSKWGYTKSAARDFLVGYAIDDDGYAVDRVTRQKLSEYKDPITGKVIKINERSPGEFLKYHPEYLKQCAYNLKDEHGYYYDAKDQDGNFIGRVYKNDGAAIKEILANWDMPINDPINGVYGMLAGIKQGELADKYPYLDGVGLASYSTTLQRATLSAGFKEKAAFAGPMYATSVGQRYIKDLVHLNIARLDNLIKTAKPSGFNTQDQAEFGQLMQLMNPENWDWMLFDEESLRSFRNVNGRPMKGTRYLIDPATGEVVRDEKGRAKYEEIDPVKGEVPTHQELINTVIRKFLAPAAPKFATMMSRITPNIMDNQKPGVADNWNGLLDAMEKWNEDEYKEKYIGLNNPFAEQQNDTFTRAKKIHYLIRPKSDSNKPSGNNKNKPFQLTEEDRKVDREYEQFERTQDWSAYNSAPQEYKNHSLNIEMLAAQDGDDTNAFIHDVKQYLDEASLSDDRINDVIDGFRDFEQENRLDMSVSTEDYVDALKDLLATFLYED
ncbi:MFS transporter [Candidatus Saccharibacteria bacterium]|nr:MFS transporter [Candidatus Saccharibacteria bacterium]